MVNIQINTHEISTSAIGVRKWQCILLFAMKCHVLDKESIYDDERPWKCSISNQLSSMNMKQISQRMLADKIFINIVIDFLLIVQ
jgi:hypothetical protein